jgi:hypothetical protein
MRIRVCILAVVVLLAVAAWARRLSRNTPPEPMASPSISDKEPTMVSTRPNSSPGSEDTPIVRFTFDAATLVAEHPPRITHPNKKIVYQIACPVGCVHSGTISFSRWHEAPLPVSVDAYPMEINARSDVFGYEAPAAGFTEWYVNFADQDLFLAYGSALFAQDEHQVAEHPALASLREALLARNLEPATLDHGRSSPILVSGVERRCAINTAGIYGQRFGKADPSIIQNATKVLNPPTLSNILAIAAPLGRGAYSRKDIQFILATAYTGFRAAKMESPKSAPKIVIHTGYWGCGAFGGNRELMARLQLIAARLAKVDRVVFHTFDEAGLKIFNAALDTSSKISESNVPALIDSIVARGYQWGTGDGN